MSSDCRAALLALAAVAGGGWLLDAHMRHAGLASLHYERTAVASVLDAPIRPPAIDSAAAREPLTLMQVDAGPPPLMPAEARAAEMRAAAAHELRVCADPTNLPFSDRAGKGFENAIATIVARDLGRTVRYMWWSQRRGFIRNTLNAGRCDVVMSVPAGYDLVRPTQPYYRSTYVFVTRRDRHLRLTSFDDPRLGHLTIGLASTGDGLTPAAQALAMRGLIDRTRAYSVLGDGTRPDPQRGLIDAVARGDIDVAVAWGPLAGYYAQHEPVPLDIEPAPPPHELPSLQMSFPISMGVRREDRALAALLDLTLARRRSDIQRVLARFGVPLRALETADGRLPSLASRGTG